jgi:hypothetical protein
MKIMLKAVEVQTAHAEFLAAMEATDQLFQKLVLLTPSTENTDGKPAQRMITPDMRDSAQAVARSLKVSRLDALVIAQTLMGYTEEAREASVQAQLGEGAALPIVDEPAPRDPGFKLVPEQ